MSKSSSGTAGGGIGFGSLLAIVFITLKLVGVTEVATWSWLWVLSPLWLPFAIVLGIIAALFLGAVLVAWVASW